MEWDDAGAGLTKVLWAAASCGECASSGGALARIEVSIGLNLRDASRLDNGKVDTGGVGVGFSNLY